MTPDDIGRNYDQIAERWFDDSFPRTNGIEQHERAVAFLDSRRNALDIGCGCNGRIIDHLLGHGFSVEGIDVSSRMIELARKRHPAVTFHHADIIDWEFPERYDFISAWDSIWHLPLEAQEPTLKKILRGLSQLRFNR